MYTLIFNLWILVFTIYPNRNSITISHKLPKSYPTIKTCETSSVKPLPILFWLFSLTKDFWYFHATHNALFGSISSVKKINRKLRRRVKRELVLGRVVRGASQGAASAAKTSEDWNQVSERSRSAGVFQAERQWAPNLWGGREPWMLLEVKKS